MAKNSGKGFRIGSVDDRSQFQRPDGHSIKRDTTTGRFMEVKHDEDPFKGVAQEHDDRKD
jgi:hypothetical protein